MLEVCWCQRKKIMKDYFIYFFKNRHESFFFNFSQKKGWWNLKLAEMISKFIIFARNLRQNHRTLSGYTCVEGKNSHYSTSYLLFAFFDPISNFWQVVFARLKKCVDFFVFLSLIFSRFLKTVRICGEFFGKIEVHLHTKLRPKLWGTDALFGQNAV